MKFRLGLVLTYTILVLGLEYVGVVHSAEDITEGNVTTNSKDNRYEFHPQKNLTMTCNFTEDPEVKFKWSKGTEEIFSNSSFHFVSKDTKSLTIANAGYGDIAAATGVYTCTTESETIDKQLYRADMAVFMKPQIHHFDKSINILEGEVLQIQCRAYGSVPINVTWYKDGITVDSAAGDESNTVYDGEMKLVQNFTDAVENGYISNFTIANVSLEDRGRYRCTARNDGGSTLAELNVRVKGKLDAVWPFLGICIEVILLCSVIFIYEKKRSKESINESDTDNTPERKPAGNKDSDVRHRK